jgi:site-specific DNA-methyltransferase (adenine-specific)
LPQLAWAHAHETLVWAVRRGARHTFNYDAINSWDPAAQVGSVWRMPPPSRREKLHGSHPTQKPLRLVRRALVACAREGDRWRLLARACAGDARADQCGGMIEG